jgi:addiction module HigA family antidote
VNELINKRRGVTPATALRLAKFFGNSPAFWMNLQLRWELYHATQTEGDDLRKIRRVVATGR